MKFRSSWATIVSFATIVSLATPAVAAQESNAEGKIKAKIDNGIEVTDDQGSKINLSIIEDEIGQKTYKGKTSKGKDVKVVLLEKPSKDTTLKPSPKMNQMHDWTKSYTVHDPAPETEITYASDIPEPLAKDMVASILIASTEDSVAIAWAEDPLVDSYQITGPSIKKRIKGNSASVGNLTPNEEYTFAVDGISQDPESSVSRSVMATTLAEQGLAATTASTTQTANDFVYRTFIPPAKVDLNLAATVSCGAIGQSGVQFGGDNRSYYMHPMGSVDPSSYRTKMIGGVQWPYSSNQGYVTRYKDVKATNKYVNGVLTETRTATSDNMKFEEMQMSPAYAQIRLNHSAGNPFCSKGAITYNVMIRFYINGTVETVGWRQRVPAHEGTITFRNKEPFKAYKKFHFRLPNQSFNCLWGPACATESLNFRSVADG